MRRLLAVVALGLGIACSGCTIQLVRQSKDDRILEQRIAFYEWLYERGVTQADPRLASEGARTLLGLEPEEGDGAEEREEPPQREVLEALVRRLIQWLEENRSQRGEPAEPPESAEPEERRGEARPG
jgi:hypothetical protein